MKNDELKQLGLDGVLIAESQCKEMRRLDYVCRMLKKRAVICDTWFFYGDIVLRLQRGRSESGSSSYKGPLQPFWGGLGDEGLTRTCQKCSRGRRRN